MSKESKRDWEQSLPLREYHVTARAWGPRQLKLYGNRIPTSIETYRAYRVLSH